MWDPVNNPFVGELATAPYPETQRQLTYRLRSTDDNSHICELVFEFEHIDLKPLIGSVHVTCKYPGPTGGTNSDPLGFNWTYQRGFGFKATIEDFILSIKGQGIGTFIFYVVCSNLPLVDHRTLHIAGKLVEQDSNELRDEFWKKLIDFDRDRNSRFLVDEAGYGRFSGFVSLPRISAHPKLLISLTDTTTVNIP